MSPSAVLKTVKQRYPELKKLPRAKLRLVEEALVYASQISIHEELLSDQEHQELLKKISPSGISPGNSLRAYRLRANLTQQELAKRSGIPQANISAMERGQRPMGLNMAKRIADILKCDYKKLI